MNGDELFEEDLKFICEHLGSFVEEETPKNGCLKRYEKHPEALLFLRDILKALRQNETFTIELLAKWNTVKSHLIPLFVYYQRDASLTFLILHILTRITMNMDLHSLEPEEVHSLKLAFYTFKQDLCESPYDSTSPFKVLVDLMLSPLANYEKHMLERKKKLNGLVSSQETQGFDSQSTHIPGENGSDKDEEEHHRYSVDEEEGIEGSREPKNEKVQIASENREANFSGKDMQIIELGLTFIRNVLAISNEESPVASTQLQSKLIGFLDKYFLYELLFTLSSNLAQHDGKQLNFLLMEIIYHTFFGFSPDKLFDACKEEIKSDSHPLLRAIHDENLETRKSLLFQKSPRMQVTFQIGTDPRHIVHGVLKEVQNFTLDRGKGFRNVYRAKQDAYLRLNEFVNLMDCGRIYKLASDFLKTSFNKLMASVRRDFERQDKKILDSDYLTYFWIIQFFLDFQRKQFEKFYKSRHPDMESTTNERLALTDDCPSFDLVIEAFDIPTFQIVMKMSRNYMENRLWGALHISICVLRQILASLEFMVDSNRDEWISFATHLQNNFFYDGNCFSLLRQILHDFKRQSRGFLVDTVIAVHVLLRSLEKYLQQKRHMFIRQKKRKTKAKKISQSNNSHESSEEPQESQSNENSDSHLQTHETSSDSISDRDDDDKINETLIGETVDKEFRFENYEISFASEAILHNYCILLKDFRSNDVMLNHCIAKMFYRIFVNCKLEAIFYKLSILVIFNKLLQSPVITDNRKSDTCHELRQFSKLVCRKFFERVSEYPFLLVEILFPKRRSDCYFIQFGENYRRNPKAFTDEESHVDPANLAVPASDSDREESSVPVNLDFSQFKKLKTRWNAKHVEKLKNLHQKHGDTPDAIKAIVNELGNRTVDNVERQLIKMKLIPKPPKKRVKRSSRISSTSESDLGSNEITLSDDSSSSDRENIRHEIEILRQRLHSRPKPPITAPLDELPLVINPSPIADSVPTSATSTPSDASLPIASSYQSTSDHLEDKPNSRETGGTTQANQDHRSPLETEHSSPIIDSERCVVTYRKKSRTTILIPESDSEGDDV